MPDREARAVFEAYLRATGAQDLTALESIVHPDFEEFYPQSRERTRGVRNLQAILENYPNGGYQSSGPDHIVGTEDRWVMTPAFTLLRVEGAGDTFTGVSRARYPDGSDWYIVSIGQIRDGKVWRLETYFGQTFVAPGWRAQWVEREAST